MYPMFIVALFTIARTWRQQRCPSTDEQKKQLWCIKGTHLSQFYELDEASAYYAKGSKKRGKQISYINIYTYEI